jgi:hypothetical protein
VSGGEEGEAERRMRRVAAAVELDRPLRRRARQPQACRRIGSPAGHRVGDIPLLLLKAAFGLVGFLIALPFKLIGGLLHLAAGAFKIFLGLALLAILVVALPVLIALIPVALGAGCIFIGIKLLTAIA